MHKKKKLNSATVMILEMSFRGNGNSVYVDVLEGIDVVRLLSGEI